jgi:hypothetical protein
MTLSIVTLNTLCFRSFMLSVANKSITLNVFMLNVVAPQDFLCLIIVEKVLWHRPSFLDYSPMIKFLQVAESAKVQRHWNISGPGVKTNKLFSLSLMLRTEKLECLSPGKLSSQV